MAQLLAFLAVAAVVIVTPGQDTALTIRNTLLGGSRAGRRTAAGVAAGQTLWALAASLGLAALLAASEPVFLAIRLAGAAYLVWLGLQALWSAAKPFAISEASVTSARRGAPFRQGLVSNLGNPKMAVFFTSLLPQFGGTSFPALLALGPPVPASVTLSWLSAYAAAVASAGRRAPPRPRSPPPRRAHRQCPRGARLQGGAVGERLRGRDRAGVRRRGRRSNWVAASTSAGRAKALVQVPLAMMNRHGLIAGATGTGKTRTLQGLAEQLSAAGVPVFAADNKGDLSGLAEPGAADGPAQAWPTRRGVPADGLPGRVPRARRHRAGRAGAGNGHRLRAAAARQGARGERDAGAEPQPRVPVRRPEGLGSSTWPTCARC